MSVESSERRIGPSAREMGTPPDLHARKQKQSSWVCVCILPALLSPQPRTVHETAEPTTSMGSGCSTLLEASQCWNQRLAPQAGNLQAYRALKVMATTGCYGLLGRKGALRSSRGLVTKAIALNSFLLIDFQIPPHLPNLCSLESLHLF